MRSSTYLSWALLLALITIFTATDHSWSKQTLAPHELKDGDAPRPIIDEPPSLRKSTINLKSAEEKDLRAVVISKELHQPWSLAFLPDGIILVTERGGSLRVIRNGKLLSSPVAGVPRVQTGGPRGLQGLMDIAPHPNFSENGWIYLAYHRPAGGDAGETVLAKGTWNGTALMDVRDIFESGATETEASRIAFGRDGMLYMSISAPGSPTVKRAQNPNDYAGKTVRLRDDGSIPNDNPFVNRSGFKRAFLLSVIETAMVWLSILKLERSGKQSRVQTAAMRSTYFVADGTMGGHSSAMAETTGAFLFLRILFVTAWKTRLSFGYLRLV